MSKNTDLAVINFSPTLEVPDNAPPMPIDPSNEAVSFDDLFPANFFSMEDLANWLTERKAESRILTVTGASMELLFDPATEKPKDGRWLPCLSFEETSTKLVINKSRGNQLRRMTGSPLFKAWAHVGQIAIKAGIENGKAQIVIERVPTQSAGPEESLEDFNKSMFGDNS